jgi:2-polyprenyl-3-methyl-5-hydroxy-6-metoxy-1,4-benzoquinol methylase
MSRPADLRDSEADSLRGQDDYILRIIRSYDSWVVRAYVYGRFQILRRRFLEEIGQYLPDEGNILDVGCGFGLFSLYYAMSLPRTYIRGFDLNKRRIITASTAAARLGLRNVSYEVRDARYFRERGHFTAIYMLDIIHHLPPGEVDSLLSHLTTTLEPGGILLIKDVDTRPTYKRLFTRALDGLMDIHGSVCYWDADRLQKTIASHGYRTYRHLMVDYLPYPHVLFICQKL